MPYTKNCSGCGAEFQTADFRKSKCKKNCNRKRDSVTSNNARKKKQNEHAVEFIAVDGEGINAFDWVQDWEEDDDGFAVEVQRRVPSHHYVLLSVGDQTLHSGGAMLTHREIFPFLYDQYLKNPKAAFVGYFLGYDFSQWFKSLPDTKGWSLLTKEGIARRQPANPDIPFPWPVRCDDWEFDILANKRFKLRPHVPRDQWKERIVSHRDGTQTITKAHPHGWMYVCDTGSFFQSSFMSAIDPSGWEVPIVTDAEYAVLEEGKSNRDAAVFGDDMIRYNLLENAVLPRLLEQLNLGFVGDDIRLRKDKWFGPGQAAQIWLGNVGCPTGETIRETVPDWARSAAKESYFGGWFEIMAHGPIPGETFSYDINSAYPATIATLPCLLHGKWRNGERKNGKLNLPRLPDGAYRLVDASVVGPQDSGKIPTVSIGAMMHRQASGGVLRPSQTSGWYWMHEIDAAKRAGLVSKVRIEKYVDYIPCDCSPPLGSIADLYEGRLKVGKNSAFGKAKKLVYNSSYGKLAQSVGSPRFANPIYASLITAGCRSAILEAIATHPDKDKGVVMVATDSVTFYTPHPNLEIHPTKLGAWDGTTHTNLSLMMPGLYWDDVSRQRVREGKSPKVKSRGVPARDLAKFIDDIDRQWELEKVWGRAHDNMVSESMIPRIDIPIAFAMTSAKLAASQNRWEDCGRVIHDGVRELSANPFSKRYTVSLNNSVREGGVIVSSVWRRVADEPRSTPYDKAFGEPAEDRLDRGDITQDGDIAMSIRSVIP